jgi:transcriptional regulator with XRE-family HTH domain
MLVHFLRSRARMTQLEFGKACRVDQAEISHYERDKAVPEDVLRRMAKVARLEWHVVVHLRRLYEAVLAAEERRQAVADAGPLNLAILEPALLAVTPYLIEDAMAEQEPRPPAEERREAAEVWAALERFPDPQRRWLIERSLRSGRSVALAACVCEASVHAAAHDVKVALELADLALFIAERVPESRRSGALGYCWGHTGNARRVATDYDGADAAFAKAWEFWQAGPATDAELLPEWRLLDLEASLRRAQHRFWDALTLLDRARAACEEDPIAAGRILLAKGNVFDQMGDTERSLAALREAAPFVEAAGDLHLLFALRFNMVDDLTHLEKFEEAAELLPCVRGMAVDQGNKLELVRLVWLAAKVSAGQGRSEEAIAGLEQVSGEFTDADLPYEAALSSLDLAIIWLKAGRNAEVRGLAVTMEEIFKAKKIDREALVALRLFWEAARQETATVELARRVMAEIEKARRSAPSPG